MATQMGSTTKKKRRLDQIAILNARQSLLPQMMMNKQRTEDLTRADEMKNIQIGQFDQQYEQDQERMDFAKSSYRQQKNANERAARVGMGLEAAKLGVTIGTQYGGNTVGGFTNSIGSMTGATGLGAGMSPMISELSLGAGIGGALTGFGTSRLISKKKKGARFAAGAASGALAGALSGGPGGAIAGAFGGGFGSLF
jgi:hypothetical protein